MNKDKRIADFKAEGNGGFDTFVDDVQYFVTDARCPDQSLLPYNHFHRKYHILSPDQLNEMLSEWLSLRNAINHNHKVRQLMVRFALDEFDRFIGATHAASLNDTFWVKAESEDIVWKEVSLYRKESYNDVISRFCLGEKLSFDEITKDFNDLKVFSSSPELVTGGSFRRAFEICGGEIMFYKTGSTCGYEAWSEALASKTAMMLNPNVTPYYYELRDKRPVSRCRWFTNEKTGLVPYYCFFEGQTPKLNEILAFYEKNGCEEEFRRMVVTDALVFNTDRHLNNFGLLMDNDSLEIKGVAPLYDFNLSLFGDTPDGMLKNLYGAVMSHSPCIGGDFLTVGREMVADSIREDLKKIRDYFSEQTFETEAPFKDRLGVINYMIRRQAEALLLNTDLPTKDVYKDLKSEEMVKNEARYEKIRILARDFMDDLSFALLSMNFTDYQISIMEDSELKQVKVFVDDNAGTGSMTLDFTNRGISHSGKQFPEALVDKACDIFEEYR